MLARVCAESRWSCPEIIDAERDQYDQGENRELRNDEDERTHGDDDNRYSGLIRTVAIDPKQQQDRGIYRRVTRDGAKREIKSRCYEYDRVAGFPHLGWHLPVVLVRYSQLEP